MKTFKTGAAIASAAAMLAIAGASITSPAMAASAKEKVQPCYGVNSCKGTSDCKSGAHECKGQNSCKGQGFKDLTAKACAAQHGSLKPLTK